MRKQEFSWPEFTKETDRVKAYSARYKDLSITEAFKKVYPDDTPKVESNAICNIIPRQAKIGDVLPLTIKSVSKEGVILDCINQKNTIITKTNLWKYKRFRDGDIPQDTISGVVTDIARGSIFVDILSPIFHNWLDPLLKTPAIQRPTKTEPMPVTVKNLQLVAGGFIGKAVIPSLTDFTGEPYEIDAFIPGSHIVLNITPDFTKFEGQTVKAFVINYIPKSINGMMKMSLICSVKEYLKYQGDMKMIDMYKAFCDGGKAWLKKTKTEYLGVVTGGIHTSTKCGVFVEIPELLITGLVTVEPDEIVNYQPGQPVKVHLTGFETERKYNGFVDQYQIVPSYKLDDDGNIIYSNFKPILVMA
jgi:hypothetical protein